MVKKYNNVLVTGDLHLGDVVFDFEKELIDILKSDSFDCVVFGGDTFDTWRTKRSIQTIINKYHLLFKVLEKLEAEIVFVKGNHDPRIDQLKKYGFFVTDSFDYINSSQQNVKIVHGHEFDKAVKHAKHVLKQLAFVEELINQVLQKFDKEYYIRLVRLMGKRMELRRYIKTFYKTILGYDDMDILMFGHTHVPEVGEENNKLFYNWGGWTKDYNFTPSYIVDSQGAIKPFQVK